MRRILIGLLLLGAVSCSNDGKQIAAPDPNTPFPYATPMVASMQPDLGDLEQSNVRGPAGLCHSVSALVVSWVNLNVAARLAVPITALGACVSEHPVYLGDETWRWTATGGAGAGAWTAELTGRVLSADVLAWAMRVSGTAGQLDRFLWFDGQCDASARSGIWQFYDPGFPQSQRELVRCTFSLPATSDTPAQILFENVGPGGDHTGETLAYEMGQDAASVIFTSVQEETTWARWDPRSGEGSAAGAQADTCCWGPRPLYEDVDCTGLR